MPPLRVPIADDHQLESPPDAGLMDLELPLLDGVHATRLLRRLLPACPVVVLTASPSSEDDHRARSAACISAPAGESEREAEEHQVAQP